MLLKSTLIFALASAGYVSALPNWFAEKRDGDGPGHPYACNGQGAARKKLLSDNGAKPIDIAVTIQERYAHLPIPLMAPPGVSLEESEQADFSPCGNTGVAQWIAIMSSATLIPMAL